MTTPTDKRASELAKSVSTGSLLSTTLRSTRSSHRSPSYFPSTSRFSYIFDLDNKDNTMRQQSRRARSFRRARKSNAAQVAQVDARISKAVTEILTLDPSQWVEAGRALHHYVEKNRKGMGKLKAKISEGIEAKVEEANAIADILKREPSLYPHDEDKVFMAFKTRRLARLFIKKPEMLEYLKAQAQAETYNKGWKTKVKLYEEIADDPEEILVGAEILCKVDETRGSLVEGMKCTIRETLDAMDWYADNKHSQISAIYEEYKDIPTKEMFEEGEAVMKVNQVVVVE